MGAFWAELVRAFHWLFEERYKLMLLAVALSSIALFLPASYTDAMMIGGWVRSHRVSEWFVFLFSTGYLFVSGLEAIKRWLFTIWSMHHLLADERQVVQSFMNQNQRTCPFIAHTASATAMVTNGILVLRSPELNRGRGSNALYFTMPGWVFRHFRNRPNLYVSL